MLILVTGAAGFVGSHIVDELVRRGHRVRGLDLLHPGAHAGPPAYLNPDAELVIGDVRDDRIVATCVADVDAVCHQAAQVGLGVDFDDVRDYVSHNDLGTATLTRAIARSGTCSRLVLASSMAVYGEGRYACSEHGDVAAPARSAAALAAGDFEPHCPRCGSTLAPLAVSEESPPDPRNVYAATKLHQEHLALALARERELALTILRYHNVYGPRMPRDSPYAGVASIFRSELEAGRTPRVFEDGGQLRDFVHVADVAAANVLALTASEPRPGTFNIASGSPRTIGEMARALARAFDPSAPDPVISGDFRLGDVRHVFARTDAARDVLGFAATTSFEAGMTEFAAAPLRASTTRR